VTELAILSDLVNDPFARAPQPLHPARDVPSSMKVDWIRIFSKP